MLADHIIMVKPSAFRFNVETAKDNAYQSEDTHLSNAEINERAEKEFLNFVHLLEDAGVVVDVVEDRGEDTPDSIFPNNTFVTFKDGLFICPMMSDNRSREFSKLKEDYAKILDFSSLEMTDFSDETRVLEGTGAMVIDRHNSICYAAISRRCDEDLLRVFCRLYDLVPVPFKAKHHGIDVYHTNVIMTVAEHFAMVAEDLITEGKETLLRHLNDTDKEIIPLTADEIDHFAGNCLELMGDVPILVMSDEAYHALDKSKIHTIEKYNKIVHAPLEIISSFGGGSARCMIAENFTKGK